MMLKHWIATAIVAGAAVAAQPAAANEIRTTGRTLATPRLAADVLRRIAAYAKATGGCSLIFSADMRVEPAAATPPAIRARGGHSEMWTLDACAAKQRFQVTMWPSPRGGSDYAVQPLTGRMPLTAM